MLSYSHWSREKLIDRIKYLESHLPPNQIENAVTTSDQDLIFSNYTARPIALRVAYLGWDYYGAAQAANKDDSTICSELLAALTKSCLIPQNTKACCLTLCGRTDKGVCAFSQVFSLWIKTNAKPGTLGTVRWSDLMSTSGQYVKESVLKDGLYDTPDSRAISANGEELHTYGDVNNELCYLKLINSYLPSTIYVTGWSPVSPGFSARHTCFERSYMYFFVAKDFNIRLMCDASREYVGEHSFVNYCKVDSRRPPKSFYRKINRCEILALDSKTLNTCSPEDFLKDDGTSKDPDTIFFLTLSSKGFLWNQVRRMMYMIFRVGLNLYPVSGIKETLLEKRDRSHSYTHAYNSSPFCLVFSDCKYPQFANIFWIGFNKESHQELAYLKGYLVKKIQTINSEYSVKLSQLRIIASQINTIPLYTNLNVHEPQNNTKDSTS